MPPPLLSRAQKQEDDIFTQTTKPKSLLCFQDVYPWFLSPPVLCPQVLTVQPQKDTIVHEQVSKKGAAKVKRQLNSQATPRQSWKWPVNRSHLHLQLRFRREADG